jgi:hypothetical protein
VLPGYSRPLIRVVDYLGLLERSRCNGRVRLGGATECGDPPRDECGGSIRETRDNRRDVSASDESELIAQELSGLGHQINDLGHKLNDLEKRLAAVEDVNARLEEAALTTARAMEEISSHWDAVYEAMRRKNDSLR